MLLKFGINPNNNLTALPVNPANFPGRYITHSRQDLVKFEKATALAVD
jgi:hypothetical protein